MASDSSTNAQHGTTVTDLFNERLRVPHWWWAFGAVIVGVFGYEIQLSLRKAPWSVVAYPVVAALIVWMLWSLGRARIRVDSDHELWAHRAHIPVSVIARAATIPASAKSAAMGRQLDPAAFLVHRAWVKTMVLLVLDDPDDPTPYWLVSTRRPAELIAALGLPDAAADIA
ncbi:DUF3093 domain-containing protein [Williamsia sp. CHRR-6]|uniref:DUF3093 domain-containing protein n=1 Tax=Williamsia sp. CHRR-6 TaxID=2835871 RepID=UPI0027DB8D57|nr:DUF3093 domain-containing protein [Williamsia sp. CHRR-6]